MGKSIKEYYEDLIKEFGTDSTVTIIDNKTTSKIFEQIDEDLEEFRIENHKREKESQEEISNVVFT